MTHYKMAGGLVVETRYNETVVRAVGAHKVIQRYSVDQFDTICARLNTLRWRAYYKVLNWINWQPTNL